ncbi:MAG: hypothetical protein CMO99_04960 [Woeseiaceae bacterium]|jgi:hypothetical protein|nr:hypothetical protein [Woeseiaceae bacterium]|tara:strand:+ start:695 stop:1081 length:387 start_codon:yes stop_codon:yes gene_type:complete
MLIHNKKFKILFSLILLNSSAQGHHSFAVEFTAEEKIAIVGTVTEIWFRNPHVRYYIETKNSSGEMENWDVRTSSPSLLVRKGWTKNTIKVGDKISIFGHPGRDGRKLLSVISIKLSDGSSLGQSYPD